MKLDETGADGLVPIRNLGNEFFHFDRDAGTLMGANTGTLVMPGMRATVKLVEAAPVTGGIGLELLTLEEADISRGPRRPQRRGKPGQHVPKGKGPKGKVPERRKLVRTKRKDAKTATKRKRSART